MKNKSGIYFLIIASAVVLFSSCRARFYTPNRNPVPLFKNAGDLYGDVSTNLFNKVDVTAGIAPVKGVGTYIGFNRAFESYEPDSPTTTTYNRKYEGSMLNLGLGYFLCEDIERNFRFEVYGDLGLGTFKNRVSGAANGYFNGNYTRIGIMPNFGLISTDRRFEFAYSVRISSISFSNASVTDSTYWAVDIDRYNSRSSYGMVEQALMFRVGSQNLKFQVQMASYHGLNSDDVLNVIPRWNASIMVGLVFKPNLLGR